MNISDVFNNNTINVFTDGSYLNNHNYAIYGAIVVIGNDLNNPIELRGVEMNSTVVRAELMGILLALIYISTHNLNNYNINLFTDSRLSRDILLNYIKNSWRYIDGNLYKNNNDMVSNPDLILQIVRIVTQNNINFSMYHISSHVNEFRQYEVEKAKDKFFNINKLDRDKYDDGSNFDELFKLLIRLNAAADNICTEYGYKCIQNNVTTLVNPIYLVPTYDEFRSFKDFINK